MLDTPYNMTWRVVESTGPRFFVTSDNPVTSFEGFGLRRLFSS